MSGLYRVSKSSRVLRIGLVLDSTLDVPDGVQQYVLTVGHWLCEQGHKVFYLVGQTNRKDIDNVHSLAHNITVRFNQNRVNIPLYARKSRLDSLLDELNLDVLHVQMPYHPYLAGHLIDVASAETKVIGTFHVVPASWLQSVGARSLQLLSRHSIKRFDSVAAVSPAARDFARLVYGVDSVIIPNAVPLTRFRHEPIFSKEPHILFLGRLVERKGCMHLLKALVELNKSFHGPYRVTIAGKGPLQHKLQAYAEKHELKNVTFTGFVAEKDKPALLASADIAVFPSTGGESFGIVLTEAMAAGSRVIIGGDNIGYRTILGAKSSLLVKPEDPIAFATRLQFFLEDSDARQSVAKWARENVKRYDIEKVGPELVRLYKGEKTS